MATVLAPAAAAPESAAVVAHQTIPGVFFEQARRLGDRPYLHFFKDGSWQTLTWSETAERATRVASALIGSGLRPGEHVALMSPNRVEWLYCDFGILAAGGVTVPIYPSLLAKAAGYITEDSKTRFAIVSDDAMAVKLTGHEFPKHVYTMDRDVAEWIAAEPSQEQRAEVTERLAALDPERDATVVYTSGTTGDPKGVVFTHRHFVEQARGALKMFRIEPEDETLSFLPYSHILGRVDDVFTMTMAGCSLWLARSRETLFTTDIQAARPTIMLGVPRVFETIYETVWDQVRKWPVYRRAIFRWAIGVGAARVHEPDPGPWLGLRLRIADRLVLDKLRERTTAGRLRFFISGGAPLNEKVEEFFWAMGVKILQGWGLTEATSAVTTNTEEKHRYRTVGIPIVGTQIKVAQDGEILVKGPCVMSGYKNQPGATADTMSDGWLKTGDMGFVDKDGFLTITDRKKDLIKTSGGKYVAPLPIEAQLEADRFVKTSLVVGDERPYIVALIVPDLPALAAETGFRGDPNRLVTDPAALTRFQALIDSVNQGLASFESIKYFALLGRDFTEADGELTPTLKKKRRAIAQNFQGDIEALYEAHRRR